MSHLSCSFLVDSHTFSTVCSFLIPTVSSSQLVDHCLAPDTSGDGTGCDNMTCIIITFRPHLSQSDDTKKRKHQEEAEAEGVELEENGNSKKAKSD